MTVILSNAKAAWISFRRLSPAFEHQSSNAKAAFGFQHSVLHGAVHPSHVLAPVIPADGVGCVDVSGGMMEDLEAGVFPA